MKIWERYKLRLINEKGFCMKDNFDHSGFFVYQIEEDPQWRIEAFGPIHKIHQHPQEVPSLITAMEMAEQLLNSYNEGH